VDFGALVAEGLLAQQQLALGSADPLSDTGKLRARPAQPQYKRVSSHLHVDYSIVVRGLDIEADTAVQ